MDLFNLAILACYVAPLFFVVRMAGKARENYDRLPDKIPVHFDLKGNADRWAKKSPLSVYWPAALTAAINASMFAFYYFYPDGKSGPGREMSAALAALNLALCFLFYRVSDATINYAMGKAKNVWPYIWLPLAAVIAASFLPAAAGVMPGKTYVEESFFCAKVDERNNPYGIRDAFTASDATVAIFIKWRNLRGNSVLRYEWFNPDGELDAEGKYTFGGKRLRKEAVTWWMIPIKGEPREESTGVWKTIVYLDDSPVLEKEFTLLDTENELSKK
ncbi:MAG: hypothetical protein BWY28_02556 [bacterium ADurb.Bin236]|nr:MAG: hypothetical protein BWY28_02556 [bacterium ADurb.Bin236]HOY65108.1 DUF1648 domain-containing protein [bacterium]HPN95710.1 DUF1648 domain-containing protein [bacterium]